jgi:hypothetical protein
MILEPCPEVSGNWTMNKVDKTGAEAQTSQLAQKRCGRCGTAVAENESCHACRKFFRVLRGRK